MQATRKNSLNFGGKPESRIKNEKRKSSSAKRDCTLSKYTTTTIYAIAVICFFFITLLYVQRKMIENSQKKRKKLSIEFLRKKLLDSEPHTHIKLYRLELNCLNIRYKSERHTSTHTFLNQSNKLKQLKPV